MAGSKTGEAVVQGFRKIRKVAVEKVKSVASAVSSRIKNSVLGRRMSALFS